VASGDTGFHGPGHPVARDADEALETLRHFSAAEQRPALMALLDAARGRGMPALLDDEALSLGLGNRGRTWPLAALPTLDAVPWHTLGRIPTAMVTGSNGKTTTVRLLAAMLRAQGLRTGHSCTDGLFIGSEALDSGDYSGPAGARTILRDPRVEAAVLETARGGMLRRGLALDTTDVAVITNISADHFGEYGIHTLEDLAAAKLTLARAVAPGGRLVLNADDPLLRHAGPAHDRVDWFTLDLTAARQRVAVREDTRLCGIDDGHLALDAGGATEPLLPITEITIAMGGDARHNLANAAAAALAAVALGVPLMRIAGVLRDFGRRHSDNPGRLQRWAVGGIEVLLDYAHNPDGLDQLLRIAQTRRQAGRLALLLGQAGNRDDAQIRALAGVAAQHRPDLVVLKDLDGYLRGRAAGEVAQLLRGVLRDAGLPPEALPVHLREVDAARAALAWARPGDVVVLPIHALTAKQAVGALLDGLQARGWRAGDPLP
jgi:UDP-N-acetylmuramyl tripeptide synthase